MEHVNLVKPAILNLLVLYSSAFCLYLVINRKLFCYYQISYLNQIKIILPVTLFALTRCIFLWVGRRFNRIWWIKISDLIGLLELLTIITAASMYWILNIPHTRTIEHIAVVPILLVINLSAHVFLFYSTWNNIIGVQNVTDLHDIHIVKPGNLQYLK